MHACRHHQPGHARRRGHARRAAPARRGQRRGEPDAGRHLPPARRRDHTRRGPRMAGIAGSRASSSAPATEQANEPPRAVSFAIRPRQVRALLWLRWKITLRGYARSWQRVVGLIFALLFIIPAAGGVASLTAFGYLTTPYAFATQILFVVVALLYLIWAALPLLQYTLNEGLDVTKLVIYPVTRGEQMVSLVISTLLDVSTLFILAFYIAIVIGFHATPLAAVVTLVALIAIYIHTVGL